VGFSDCFYERGLDCPVDVEAVIDLLMAGETLVELIADEMDEGGLLPK
jgi:hypothetical protein